MSCRLHIEPGQAADCANDKEEAGDPSGAVNQSVFKMIKGPLITNDGRGNAEGNRIGQRIQLNAKRRAGVRHPRDSSIQSIQDHRYSDQDPGPFKISLDRGADGVKAAEDIRNRK